jgi:hypothetical protein
MELLMALAVESIRSMVNPGSTLRRLHGLGRRLAIIHGSSTALLLVVTMMIVLRAPAEELRNFHHTAWSSDSELGAVFDIQQSPDGYLWLTT